MVKKKKTKKKIAVKKGGSRKKAKARRKKPEAIRDDKEIAVTPVSEDQLALGCKDGDDEFVDDAELEGEENDQDTYF